MTFKLEYSNLNYFFIHSDFQRNIEINYIIIRFYNEIHALDNSNFILFDWIFAWKLQQSLNFIILRIAYKSSLILSRLNKSYLISFSTCVNKVAIIVSPSEIKIHVFKL